MKRVPDKWGFSVLCCVCWWLADETLRLSEPLSHCEAWQMLNDSQITSQHVQYTITLFKPQKHYWFNFVIIEFWIQLNKTIVIIPNLTKTFFRSGKENIPVQRLHKNGPASELGFRVVRLQTFHFNYNPIEKRSTHSQTKCLKGQTLWPSDKDPAQDEWLHHPVFPCWVLPKLSVSRLIYWNSCCVRVGPSRLGIFEFWD